MSLQMVALRAGALAGALLLAGCGTLASGRTWGQDATPRPGWERVGWAAKRAILDPGTWAPAAGAAVTGAGGFDRTISDWTRRRNPIFGSAAAADSASSAILGGLRVAAIGSALATPSGTEAGDWAVSKVKGLAVEWAASGATTLSVDALKSVTGRTRPNASDDRAFPSSHASAAFLAATLLSRNLDSIEIRDSLRVVLRVGAYSAAGTAAWARVEAQAHYPSDVLAGAALGHFLGSFVRDAFLGLPDGRGPEIEVVPTEKGAMVVFTFSF
ncbi:MAG: hypothetical protein A3G76_05125 [Acidobacteria bacterium RIFCSPLOWO2_12_FULL_65_11]|nr:MAG: hypothetical protein A3H95_10450 [Acidobacteria bacterium RIFCSPLOWO2_02_FULL_64_15]OFW31773.1 MAG: hypothetical protein A3G76_05125 [Acidobacteria bacterium RIFCSPLOWO2_12_FULL_65_11]